MIRRHVKEDFSFFGQPLCQDCPIYAGPADAISGSHIRGILDDQPTDLAKSNSCLDGYWKFPELGLDQRAGPHLLLHLDGSGQSPFRAGCLIFLFMEDRRESIPGVADDKSTLSMNCLHKRCEERPHDFGQDFRTMIPLSSQRFG